ncbi:MAG: PKD domain-containing protein, partial [Acidobacteriota bacterium]
AEATTLGDTDYIYEWEYEFHVELVADRFRLWIDEGLEIDVTGDFSGLAAGSFGLYNHRHEDNIFSRLRAQPADPATDASALLAPFVERYDLRNFTQEDVASTTQSPGFWSTELSGRMVRQLSESRPSFFYSDEDINFRTVEGTLRVEGDDGFIGMAFGFEPGDTTNPDADYILVVWKQKSTSGSQRGLKEYHVKGIPGSFWTLHDQPEVTPLGVSASFADVGYQDHTSYRFSADLDPDRFRLWINGVLEIDASGTFTDGRMAFYNHLMDRSWYRSMIVLGHVIEEGDTVLDAVVPFSDPGLLDIHGGATVEFDGVVESAAHGSSPGVAGVVVSHTFEDDLSSDGEACIADDVDVRCAPIPIRVVNVAPTVTVPGIQVTGSSTVALDGVTFTDPGVLDTHTATVDWGAGTGPEAATHTFSAGSGTVDAGYVYGVGGTYTVTICVIDDDGGEGCDSIDVTVTGGTLSLSLDDSYPAGGIYPGGEVTYTATLSHGSGTLANARLTEVPSAELSVVPGSVWTSAGTVASEQPLDIDLGNLTAPSTVTVTYRAKVEAPPAGDSISTQLLLVLGGADDVLSNDPSTPEVDDATETPMTTGLGGFDLNTEDWTEGLTVTLDASFYNGSGLDTYTATLDWGDGSPLETPTVSAN